MHDQKRVGYPDDAIEKGADYIVVGRQIIDSDSPVDEAKAIINEMEAGWSRRMQKIATCG